VVFCQQLGLLMQAAEVEVLGLHLLTHLLYY
jgi:hypothetical protein